MEFPIRLAVMDDADTIAEMSRRLVETDLRHSWTARRVANHIRSDIGIVIVAYSDDVIVGFSLLQCSSDSAHLNLLAVEPAYRRRGIGRSLVKWLEKPMRVAGIEFVDLEVRSSNHRALSFYAGLGYRETGMIPGYYDGVDDATLLALDIRTSDSETAD